MNHPQPWKPPVPSVYGDLPKDLRVPENARLPLGAHPIDVRGKSYLLAFGSLTSGLFSIVAAFFLMLGGIGLSMVPSVLAIILGILALRKVEETDPLPYRNNSRTYSIWGIVTGAIGVVLSIASLILSVWLFSNI